MNARPCVLVTTGLREASESRLRAEFPDVQFIFAPGDGAVEAARWAEVLFGGQISAAMLERAEVLRWVHVRSAGVNHLPLDELARRGVLLTNGSGAHGTPIAENILAMMLAFAIRLPLLQEAKARREWLPQRVGAEKFELEGQTLLIAGLGDIGRALAVRASALGLRVLGCRRRDLPAPPGVHELVPLGQLHAGLGRADHVALCLPLTADTRGFLGERELRSMRPTAYVYNVGRGGSIGREALHRALREGWIAGAGLDVTDPEPLQPDDPLWDLPNVILTQHTSGGSPRNEERVVEIFMANLRRWLGGQTLQNVVDYGTGY